MFEKVTCKEISNWYYNRMRTLKEEFCNLDQRLFERAREYVADKNEKFLKDLTLTCYGVKYCVVFSAGRKLNRFTLMVSGDSIRGTMNRESPSNGVSNIFYMVKTKIHLGSQCMIHVLSQSINSSNPFIQNFDNLRTSLIACMLK